MHNILNEAEGNSKTVNEVQLSDLFANASKAEQTIITLAGQAVQFNDPAIKQSAAKLRSVSHEFTTLVLDTMLKQNIPTGNLEKPLPGPGEKQPLGLGSEDKEVIESADVDNGFIEEAWNELIESEVKEKTSDARKVLAEAFALPENKVIDLTLAYNMITEGKSSFAQFKQVVYKALNEGNFGDDYKSLVVELRDAGTPELYEVAMNKIYDFADANNIEIKTA